MENAELEQMWTNAGGTFNGPDLSTGQMPKEQLLQFLRNCVELPKNTIRVQHALIEFGGGTKAYPKKVVLHAQRLGWHLGEMADAAERPGNDHE